MSTSTLREWCSEARALLGTPGSVSATKLPELQGKAPQLVGTLVSQTRWDAGMNGINGQADPAAKDRATFRFGRELARRKVLFGNAGLSAAEVETMEPVADAYSAMGDANPAAVNACAAPEGSGGMANMGELPEELKAEFARHNVALTTSIRSTKDPAEAFNAVAAFQEFLEGVTALDANLGKVRGKYSSVEQWGRVQSVDMAALALAESRIAAKLDEFEKVALPDLERVLNGGDLGGNRRAFLAAMDRLKQRRDQWRAAWDKVRDIYVRMDLKSEEGLGGLEDIVDDALALATSDDYLNPDEGLKALKAECDGYWTTFAAATTANRPGLRGPFASARVKDLNAGRAWRGTLKIGTGLYRLSNSVTAGVSFKRTLPQNLLISTHPHIQSFIYHL